MLRTYWDGEFITCPICGCEHGDPWEYNMYDGDQVQITCCGCNNEFIATCCVTTEYMGMFPLHTLVWMMYGMLGLPPMIVRNW